MADDGRNAIRFSNSGARTLIENWVEERSVAHIDGTEKFTAELQRQGHKGVLTTNFGCHVEGASTTMETYKKPCSPNVRTCGVRRECLEREIKERVSQEVHCEFNPPPPPPDFTSTTKKDFFSIDFTPIERKPEKDHDLYQEQPMSFWIEQSERHGVSGLTQAPIKDKPFHRNAAFSTPIGESYDSPKPHEK
ncbi:sperm-associated antigen 8-like [Corticium candelabrum]|uniref:sperm-associated antigen 8-like n=1 Tax=Corticium candelabrum TaxID=121492 RepID=UPI002E259ED7|nr:sperm-associated antigen 8-like [Corticium candelabrum]